MDKVEKIISEFLENKEFIWKLYWEYKVVIDYYDEIHWFWFNGSKMIYDFIKNNYSEILKNKSLGYERTIKRQIIDILDYDFQNYCNKLVEEKNIINDFAYSVFHQYNYIDETDFQGINLVDDAKNNAYTIIFLKIQKEFILFLENKILDKNSYIEKLNLLDTKTIKLSNLIESFKD